MVRLIPDLWGCVQVGEANPYSSFSSERDIGSESGGTQLPTEFNRSDNHGLVWGVCLIGGGLMVGLGLVMFLLHLFVIPGNNQLTLHLSSTMPILLGLFTLVNAYHLSRAPDAVRLWPQGIEIEGSERQMFAWDHIGQVAVEDALGGQRKIAKLLDQDGMTITSISGVDRFDEMVSAIRASISSESTVSVEAVEKPKPAQVKRGRKRAIGFGLGGLLALAGSVFMVIDGRWHLYENQRMTEASIESSGTVVDRKVAPNGTTKRLYVEVESEDGRRETHNFQVEDWLYQESQIGESIEVRTDPADPRVTELLAGQVSEKDVLLDSPAASFVMSAILFGMAGLFLGTGALAWRGYDLNFEHGKFRLVPIAG